MHVVVPKSVLRMINSQPFGFLPLSDSWLICSAPDIISVDRGRTSGTFRMYGRSTCMCVCVCMHVQDVRP